MSFKPFMGVSDSSGDGPIFVDTISSSKSGKMVDNLGNSDMKSFSSKNRRRNFCNMAIREEDSGSVQNSQST